jgi:hypothetical protein
LWLRSSSVRCTRTLVPKQKWTSPWQSAPFDTVLTLNRSRCLTFVHSWWYYATWVVLEQEIGMIIASRAPKEYCRTAVFWRPKWRSLWPKYRTIRAIYHILSLEIFNIKPINVYRYMHGLKQSLLVPCCPSERIARKCHIWPNLTPP